MKRILKTESSWGALVARLTLGIILFPHGAQKMLGWFGGYGFSGTLDGLVNQMHLPKIVAIAVILIEFFGSIFLITGLASRLWSLAFIGLFSGIIITTQLEFGFFMNWYGTQAGEGFEFSLLIIGIAAVVMILGSGKYALDNQLLNRLNQQK